MSTFFHYESSVLSIFQKNNGKRNLGQMFREDWPEQNPPNVYAVTKRLRCYASFIKNIDSN